MRFFADLYPLQPEYLFYPRSFGAGVFPEKAVQSIIGVCIVPVTTTWGRQNAGLFVRAQAYFRHTSLAEVDENKSRQGQAVLFVAPLLQTVRAFVHSTRST